MNFFRFIAGRVRVLLSSLVLIHANASVGQNVVAWGSNASGQTSVPPTLTNAVDVAAGTSHSIARTSEGTVVCWGNISAAPAEATNVTAIASGAGHGLALRNDGTVLAWGENMNGVLNVPVAATNVVAIAAGSYHNLALRTDGTVVAWGKTNITRVGFKTGFDVSI